jgi:hypothetical protein
LPMSESDEKIKSINNTGITVMLFSPVGVEE